MSTPAWQVPYDFLLYTLPLYTLPLSPWAWREQQPSQAKGPISVLGRCKADITPAPLDLLVELLSGAGLPCIHTHMLSDVHCLWGDRQLQGSGPT